MEPQREGDRLAEALLRDLDRPAGYWGSWGAFKSLVAGTLTLGIGPLWVWSKRLRYFAQQEQQDLWHLAEWLRLRTGRTEAVALVQNLPRWPKLAPEVVVPRLMALVVAAVLLVYWMDEGWQVSSLIGVTYGGWWFRELGGSDAPAMFALWNGSLLLGYLAHWWAVVLRARRLREFAEHFNEVMHAEGLPAVHVPGAECRIGASWLIGIVALVALGAVWGVGLMLAGAAQSRYIKKASAPVCNEMGRRVRAMLLVQRPSAAMVRWIGAAGQCPRDECAAVLPRGANYCPRCGLRVAGTVDRVA